MLYLYTYSIYMALRETYVVDGYICCSMFVKQENEAFSFARAHVQVSKTFSFQ